ncbi:unnamed protein product [Auanema sp. JU1783]|nr:unnamed protein product [Auanema sp. JU1783]
MENALEESAITFFSKMYPSSKIDFEPKPDGSQAGIMVMITCNDEKTKYYMKTYHHSCLPMTLEDISNQNMPDLRKMFAYRVLELIGVGPLVFFPYYAGSTYCPFIATEEVCEFEELYKLEDVSLKNKIVVEVIHFQSFSY